MSNYLLVHGAFCGGWVWRDVVERLRDAGHRVRAVDQLPSTGTDTTSLGGLTADADCVVQELEAADEPVVLVGHSYGGMVITEVADHPNIRHTVYLTALWPRRGESMMDLFGQILPPSIVQRDDGSLELTADFELAWRSFCPDLERTSAHRTLSRFVPQSGKSLVDRSTAPRRTHPTTYMIATEESQASVAAQEATGANADHVVRLRAAHMVQLSAPDVLAAALGRI